MFLLPTPVAKVFLKLKKLALVNNPLESGKILQIDSPYGDLETGQQSKLVNDTNIVFEFEKNMRRKLGTALHCPSS